jgi:hypothetical protein
MMTWYEYPSSDDEDYIDLRTFGPFKNYKGAKGRPILFWDDVHKTSQKMSAEGASNEEIEKALWQLPKLAGRPVNGREVVIDVKGRACRMGRITQIDTDQWYVALKNNFVPMFRDRQEPTFWVTFNINIHRDFLFSGF